MIVGKRHFLVTASNCSMYKISLINVVSTAKADISDKDVSKSDQIKPKQDKVRKCLVEATLFVHFPVFPSDGDTGAGCGTI